MELLVNLIVREMIMMVVFGVLGGGLLGSILEVRE